MNVIEKNEINKIIDLMKNHFAIYLGPILSKKIIKYIIFKK